MFALCWTQKLYYGREMMYVKQLVIVTKNGWTMAEAIWCNSMRTAKEYISCRYLKEIKKAPFYDYVNSYITPDWTYAQVSAGVYSVKIRLCEKNRIKKYTHRSKK